jgi:hypothetical protein
VTPDLRGSSVKDVIPRIETEPGLGAFKPFHGNGRRRSRLGRGGADAPARSAAVWPLHCGQDRRGRSSASRHGFLDDFTRLRDSEPGSSEETLAEASRKAGNAQCPARRGETRSEAAGSL